MELLYTYELMYQNIDFKINYKIITFIWKEKITILLCFLEYYSIIYDLLRAIDDKKKLRAIQKWLRRK